jgi:hypothetical protein
MIALQRSCRTFYLRRESDDGVSDIARADRPEQAMFRPPAARLVVPINQPAQNILKSST